jgi:hypothetical protein
LNLSAGEGDDATASKAASAAIIDVFGPLLEDMSTPCNGDPRSNDPVEVLWGHALALRFCARQCVV